MLYVLTFLEGVLTFISPCLLPLMPVFVSYFAGTAMDEDDQNLRKRRLRTLASALAFMAGFTLIFVILGIFAGTLGSFITQNQRIVDLVAGSIVVLFGIGYLGLFKLPTFNVSPQLKGRKDGLRSFFFGIVFSIGWTPCISAFLGSALMLAAVAGSWEQGALLLLFYSLGLGLPLVITALLIDSLKSAFNFIKRHYVLITRASGILLILMGLLIMSGQASILASTLTNFS
ncbi:MAG: cytochrome c biogenesis protein CcdA [Coriobacteriia bacterium]|nr:cytochrome c biogenesis protein CcdA [Coriobacteriia bacterium]